MNRGRVNHTFDDKDVTTFLGEIEELINEGKENLGNKEYFFEQSRKILDNKKVKKNEALSIHEKLKVFAEEVSFINEVVETYTTFEKAKKKEKEEEEQDEISHRHREICEQFELNYNEIKKEIVEYIDHILEALTKIKNKEFAFATKMILKLRVEDFKEKEINEDYFQKKIKQLCCDIHNELALEENAKNEIDNDDICDEKIEKEENKCEVSKKLLVEEEHDNENPIDDTNIIKEKLVKRKKKPESIERSNLFHRKKLKLVERWNKVQKENKIESDYSSH